MEQRRIIRGGIVRRITEGREIVFKPASNAPARIIKGFIDIAYEFILDCGQCRPIFAPNPESVARVGVRKVLIDQPSVQESKRQTPKAYQLRTSGGKGCPGSFVPT